MPPRNHLDVVGKLGKVDPPIVMLARVCGGGFRNALKLSQLSQRTRSREVVR
jgi:hypothetical protein